MQIKKILFLLIFTAIISVSFAQKFTISGYVREKSTGEDLIGANVYIKSVSKGTTTNQYGFYSLSLEKGKYIVTYSFIGYKDYEETIILDKDIKKNVNIENSVITTNEVIISAEKTQNIQSTQMGQVKLSIEKIKAIPAFLGEIDILKTIQLLPGVQSGGEGSSGFYVRGGGPDQNLILLDDATVYNASHLFGFFSVFNADAVKDINLIKGGMPAQYGGRLSSVLDITMKDGNNRKFEVDGGIGVISSRLTIQGPIKKDTSSFIVSARCTYIDILIKPFVKETAKAKGSGYYFYDLNAKASYRFSDKDRVFISGYYGKDVAVYKNKEADFDVNIPWGNGTASLRWNHLFSDKLFSNTIATYSNYKFNFKAISEDMELNMFSGITDYSIKSDFNFLPSPQHNLKFGLQYVKHIFVPSSVTAKVQEATIEPDAIDQHARDASIYINEDFDINENLKVSGGLRGTFFQQVGPFTRYVKDADDKTIDTLTFDKGKNVKAFKNVEPRFSMRYAINKNNSFKASYTQNYQYIHLATISSASMPTDLWIPSSDLVKPQFGVQYSVGYFKNFKNDNFETSAEIYYKELENQIEYKDGAMPMNNIGDNTDNMLTFGKGRSYGLELFIKKKQGKTTGWIGYTLSKTDKTFADLNNGETYSAKYDRRHDISFTLTHEISEKWTFSMVWVYASGNTMSIPEEIYLINNQLVFQYGDINSFRMKPYHRLDLSATYIAKKTDKYESSWNFSIFNAYNRYNPYFIYFKAEGNINKELVFVAKQVSLFPILPSITWNFKF
jgi:hypothetical protein